MAAYRVKGGARLQGTVRVSGSKNAVLPIMAATILVKDRVIIENVPRLEDVNTLIDVLKNLGCQVLFAENTLTLDASSINRSDPLPELVRKMRASCLVIGPLLATLGTVSIPLPGGCAIGTRPIDLHLKGLTAMGAEIKWNRGLLELKTRSGLKGARVYLDFPSVGATENIMTAAVAAKGDTVIENAALEPEIVDLARFLADAGADINGAGSPVIRIRGSTPLRTTTHRVIPDRIEAGTYMVSAAATQGHVTVTHLNPEHLKAITAKLIESGARVQEDQDKITVYGPDKIRPLYLKTMPYPGFPTDMQPQFMAYLTRAQGTSMITETVFENRFMHVGELLHMGADIKTEGRTAIIRGVKELLGARLEATDLRAGAALIIAALQSEDESIIEGVEHLDRGYENLEQKLTSLGAHIERISG